MIKKNNLIRSLGRYLQGLSLVYLSEIKTKKYSNNDNDNNDNDINDNNNNKNNNGNNRMRPTLARYPR